MECLGLPLAPYTLRHELVLLRQRSPFLCMSEAEFNELPKSQQVFALTLAAQLCASRKPGWFWKHRDHDYALGVAEFWNYLREGRRLLPVLSSTKPEDKDAYEMANDGEKMSAGRPLGSPLLAQLIHYCMSKDGLGLDYESALDSPFAHVANMYFSHLESAGSLYIENHKEAEVKAEMAEKRLKNKTECELAEIAWKLATTPEKQRAAYEAHPHIGNLFAKEFYAAKNDDERDVVVDKWGFVAITELKKAGISRKDALWQD